MIGLEGTIQRLDQVRASHVRQSCRRDEKFAFEKIKWHQKYLTTDPQQRQG